MRAVDGGTPGILMIAARLASEIGPDSGPILSPDNDLTAVY
jgi:hypothetical protein